MLALRERRKRLSALLPLDSWIWLLPIVLLAAALRLYHIGYNSLWFDEAFSWLVSQQTPISILTDTPPPILPPAYHILLHYWTLLGDSETSLRLFSTTCSIMSIPVLYAIGRRLFGPKTGLATSLLLAVLPFQVYFAQEARLYSLVVLLAAIVLWLFVKAWDAEKLVPWLLLGIAIAAGFYTHYFIAFTALVLNGFVLLAQPGDWRKVKGMFCADGIALVLVAPQLSSAFRQTREVATNFWLSKPSPLQPVVTLDFLLFSHTTPVWAVPLALFVTLAILALTVLMISYSDREHRQWLWLFLSLTLLPPIFVFAISWLVGPAYLDRSFSVVTPAYALILGWAIAHLRWKSPTPFLFLALGGLVILSLVNHYSGLDPAKSPFREASQTLKMNAERGDAVLHLHCSSYLPFEFYHPPVDSYLLNNDPNSWIPASTWAWAGRRISSLDEFVVDRNRLWVVIMPNRMDEHQKDLSKQIEAEYQLQDTYEWDHWDPIEIRLYESTSPGRRESDETR